MCTVYFISLKVSLHTFVLIIEMCLPSLKLEKRDII